MSDGCKITVICENSVAGSLGLIGEHGWSLLLERGAQKILFDTGQGLGFLHNSKLLGIDLPEIDAVVLSHGHYDHTSGLGDLFREGGGKDMYCHPDCFAPRYSVRGLEKREIGIPFTESKLEALGARIHKVSSFTEIYTGIFLTGTVPRITDFETVDPQLKVCDGEGQWQQDMIWDDMSLVVRTEKGLVVILGCAHAGIVNILRFISSELPGIPIDTVIGGTHLGFADAQQFEKTLQALQQYHIQRIGTAHCTGLANGAKLHQHFPEQCFFAAAGTVVAC